MECKNGLLTYLSNCNFHVHMLVLMVPRNLYTPNFHIQMLLWNTHAIRCFFCVFTSFPPSPFLYSSIFLLGYFSWFSIFAFEIFLQRKILTKFNQIYSKILTKFLQAQDKCLKTSGFGSYILITNPRI